VSERDQYRAKAKYCREMADKAISPLDKDAWLLLASDWLTASDRLDAQERAEGTHQTKSDSEH